MRGCPDASNVPLWWVPVDSKEADDQPNFDSYKKVGGWDQPFMKLFTSRELCGETVYENYYELQIFLRVVTVVGMGLCF